MLYSSPLAGIIWVCFNFIDIKPLEMCTDWAYILYCLIQTRTYSWQANKFLSPMDPPPGLHDNNGPITIWQIFLYTDNRKINATPNPHSARSPRCCCVLECAENATATVCLPLLQNCKYMWHCTWHKQLWLFTPRSSDCSLPPPPLPTITTHTLLTHLSDKSWFLKSVSYPSSVIVKKFDIH